MKTLLLLLSFTLTCHIMAAQQLTKDQALAFTEKLYQIEILSEKGKDALKERIEKNQLARFGESDLTAYGESLPTEVTVSSILNFCAHVFAHEFFYRSGFTEEVKAEVEKRFLKEGKELSEKKAEQVENQIIAYIQGLDGPKIESAIPMEDTLLSEGFSGFIGEPYNSIENNLVHHKRSVIGKTRTRTINDLNKIGLINNQIYQDIINKSKSNELLWEALIFEYAAERAFYYENYDKNKDKELQYLQQLKQAGVLSEIGYQQIVQSFKPLELKEKFNFLRYCNNSIVFDLTKYTLDPTAYYTQIIQDLVKVIPGFAYNELKVELIQKPHEYYKNRMNDYVRINIEIDTNQYIYSFYHYTSPNQSLPDVASNFHEIFNKILIERGSDQKFYYANDAANGNSNNSKFFALILMTKAQYEAWDSNNPFYRQENHDNFFTTKIIQNFIIDCEKIGLFAHLTANQINAAKQEVTESYIERYYDIISRFPNTSIDVSWESDAMEHPYQDNTMKFAVKSNGLFTPSNIIDNFYEDKVKEREKTKFGFQFKGKQYEMELDNYYDGIDPSFVSLIDKALEEQKIDGRIYGYISDTEWAGFLFLTLSQYSYLKAKHPTLFEE